MLIEQTIDKLREFRLHGFVSAMEQYRNDPQLKFDTGEELIGFCADAEQHFRANRKYERLLKDSGIRSNACQENIDYAPLRGLDKAVITNLMTCDYINNGLNIIISGPAGVGKTWLAEAFGHKAIRLGIPVLYKRASRLFEEIELAYADGSLIKLRPKLQKKKLLILDDWALTALTDQTRRELLEITDDRFGNASMIITTQLPIDDWYSYISEPTIAEAILDRIVPRSHQIHLKGDSMRRKLGSEKLVNLGES